MPAAQTVLVDLLAMRGAGQETRARALAHHLRRFDADSRFVVLRENGRLADVSWERLDAKIIDAPSFTEGVGAVRRMAWAARHLPRILREERATVYLTFSNYLAPTIRGVRTVLGITNLAPFSPYARRTASAAGRLRLELLRRSMVYSARRATRVLALSDACRRLLEEHGVEGGRIVVVSNGADAPVPTAAQAEQPDGAAPMRARGATVLSVSHFYDYKNYETLLEAFALLPEALRREHDLLLVGAPSDAAYFRRIEALAASLAERARVRIVPGLPRAELGPLYASCGVFVFPSLIENSPNVLLEAMAHGAPCVVARADPMPEYGGDAVAYFEPRSARDLASVLEGLLRDPERRRDLSARARAAVSRYRWEDLVRTTVEQYRTP